MAALGLGEGMPWALGSMGGAGRVGGRGVCAVLVLSQGVDSHGSEVAMGKQAGCHSIVIGSRWPHEPLWRVVDHRETAST